MKNVSAYQAKNAITKIRIRSKVCSKSRSKSKGSVSSLERVQTQDKTFDSILHSSIIQHTERPNTVQLFGRDRSRSKETSKDRNEQKPKRNFPAKLRSNINLSNGIYQNY